jgi:hypothetical protein
MAGLPVQDPYSAAFGAAASVASAALSDKGVQAGSTQTQNGFDNSGWVVNVGSGSATNSQSKTPLGDVTKLLGNPLVLLAIGAVLYFTLGRK